MAGEESKEVFAQKQRENRTLEAVYPRPSAIPERCVDTRVVFFLYVVFQVNFRLFICMILELMNRFTFFVAEQSNKMIVGKSVHLVA